MKLDVCDNNDIAFEVLSGYFQVNHITMRSKEKSNKVWKANTIRITFDTLSQCMAWIDLYLIKAQHDNVLNTTSLRRIIFLPENYYCIHFFSDFQALCGCLKYKDIISPVSGLFWDEMISW